VLLVVSVALAPDKLFVKNPTVASCALGKTVYFGEVLSTVDLAQNRVALVVLEQTVTLVAPEAVWVPIASLTSCCIL
jgi:hypothetical protein